MRILFLSVTTPLSYPSFNVVHHNIQHIIRTAQAVPSLLFTFVPLYASPACILSLYALSLHAFLTSLLLLNPLSSPVLRRHF
jgi:hypothetical protein